MEQPMKAWFDFRPNPFGTLLYYGIVGVTILSFLAPILTLILRDNFGFPVSSAMENISIVLLFIGVFWLVSFVFPIVYNDIKG